MYIHLLSKKAVVVLLFFIFCACQSKSPSEITLTIEVDNPNPKTQYSIKLFSYYGADAAVKFKLSEDTNSHTLTIPFLEPKMFNLRCGRIYKLLYAEPGDDLKVIINTNENNESEFVYEGSASAHVQLMEEFAKIDTDFKEKNAELKYGQYSLPWEEFSKAVDLINNKKIEAINNAKGVTEAFKKIAKAEFWIQHIESKKKFQGYYNHNIKGEDDPEMDLEEVENIYVDAFKFDKSALGSTTFGERLGWYVIDKFEKMDEEDENDIPWNSRQEIFSPMYEAVKTDESIPAHFKEYILQCYVNSLFMFTPVDVGEGIIKDFVKKYPENSIVESLNERNAKWLPLKSGEPAIDFTCENVDGKKESLSDYYGKVIYIDIWATWCGSCISEFKSSKELKARLADAEDVVFMYVSLDDADKKDKWKSDLVKYGLDGDVNLFAGKGFASPLCDSYLIEGIPKYILIDKEGKIFKSKAPRPSSGDLIYNNIQKLRGINTD